MRRSFFASLLMALSLALPATAEEAAKPASFSAEQRTEIEGIIKDYINKNPQVVVDALQAMQVQMEAEQQAQVVQAIKDNREELMKATVPVAGNPNGDVTVVEFFDYKCGYCRSTHPVVMKLLEGDKNVRLIRKEFPILGMLSMQASRYALAARNQGKYLEMHNKLFHADTQLEMETLPEIAREIGLDMDKVAKDMMSQDIMSELRANLELAQKLSIRGTPAFIIGDKLYPGSMNLEGFQQAVAEARAATKNPPPAANP